MKPVKVLYIYGDTLQYGGIEMFMMNMFRNMDREKVQIDFLLQSTRKSPLEEEIKQAGSKIYYAPKPGKNLIGFQRVVRKVLSSGEYRIVHAHCDAMNYRIMKLAKKCGVPVRIAHSHNTEHILNSSFRTIYYEYCRKMNGKYATHRWACSDAAGRWLFGQYAYNVIPNAIELEKFQFSEDKRASLRKEFGFTEQDIVLGHVGRFDYQKNHELMVNLLEALKQKRSGKRYRLLLVGDGHLRGEIEKLCKIKRLTDDVIFAGVVPNPQDYYNAMDLFLLPSLFEGYPLVITEAQANGLPCIASSRITREVNIENWVKFCPLELPAWENAVEEQKLDRIEDPTEALTRAGFNVHTAARQLQETYIRLYQEAAS